MATTTSERLSRSSRRVGLVGQMLSQPMASYYLVLVPVALLTGVGALMALSSSSVYAQSQGRAPYYYAIRQLLFLAVGIPAALWLSYRSPKVLKILGHLGMWGSFVLLALMHVPGIGVETKGNRAWIGIGPLTMQPAEFAKVALVLWSAAVLADRHRRLDEPRQLLFPLSLGFGLIIGAVLLGGDLGTAMVLCGLFFAVLWVAGAHIVLIGGLATIGLAIVGVLVAFNENRMTRIMLFLSPRTDDPSVSQQPLSAIYALATGGWFGVGLGASRQKWGNLADAAQNDFVFAVLGEEMGLVGTLTVIGLFGVLGYAGIRISQRVNDPFLRIAAGTATGWLMMQALLNIGVAMKIFPVVGVTLPFISVGGSALVANLLAAGILLACARNEPAARRLIEASKGVPRARVTSVVADRRARAGAGRGRNA
ncbi:putative lipid II flippase FtsW [Aestuariimicrobium ganziense]|uniref:putative lipid II flippase FtsW n=1 Tax=Aestuariimicrobium ganziense TaxID=2773677 RepID=UPI002E2B63BD|nr:putative lipid II flippase FtsW [Aestuariimicrobium ganziense]